MTTFIYHIRISGCLPAYRESWFDGLTITVDPQGSTLLAGPVIDQTALFGLLDKIRDLGLELISVQREAS